MVNRAGLVNEGFGLGRPASGEISSLSSQDCENFGVSVYDREAEFSAVINRVKNIK